MAKYGRNPYPRRYGGGKRHYEVELDALLDALSPGWDSSEDTASYVELLAHARAIAIIWTINGRLKNAMIPEKMLETLTTWEEACRLRPAPSDSVQSRRRAVAGKLRALTDNTVSDIYDACAAFLGPHFDGLGTVGSGSETTYWPGINPGPPGFGWTSNRATIGVKMKRLALTPVQFVALRGRLVEMLAGLIPAWLTVTVGVGSEFVVNQGIVGQTFL
jgi:hypothetical protein